MKNLIVRFLGAGDLLRNKKDDYHANLVVIYKGVSLYIGCGSQFPDAIDALYDEPFIITPDDIHYLWISNLLADQAGGLEWLAFKRWFSKKTIRPTLYMLPSFQSALSSMLNPPLSFYIRGENPLGKAFELQTVGLEESFDVGEMICTPLYMPQQQGSHSNLGFGLNIEADGKQILITSNLQYDFQYFLPYYKKAKLIFQYCGMGTEGYPANPTFEKINSDMSEEREIRQKTIIYGGGPTQIDVTDFDFKNLGEAGHVYAV